MLCAEGASVLLVARGAERLAEAAAECEAAARAGGRAARARARRHRARRRRADRRASASERFGTLDVLVNNAGTARWRDLDDVPEEDWYAAWELNVMAPMRLMRAAIPAMAERGWGRVVNVSSTAGKRPSAQMPRVLGRQGGAALALAPVRRPPRRRRRPRQRGLPRTDEVGDVDGRRAACSTSPRSTAGARRRERGAGGRRLERPIGRLAESEEIAAAIVFLCSERASYVAGAAWSVDGGTVQVII